MGQRKTPSMQKRTEAKERHLQSDIEERPKEEDTTQR